MRAQAVRQGRHRPGQDPARLGDARRGARQQPRDGDFPWDDTKRYVDKAPLTDADRRKIYEDNARRVYPRLEVKLKAVGK